MRFNFFWLFLTICLFSQASVALAIGGAGPLESSKKGAKNERPVVLDKIGIEEHLGDKIDLTLPFVDDHGKQVTLGKYFTDKPVFMLLVYYNCPTLCNVHMNTLIKTLGEFEWNAGDKYEFVVVSIDPDESWKLAEMKKKSYLDLIGKPEVADGWHFLTGEEKQIQKLASQIGFKYQWDPSQQQWAHSAAGYVLTPEGQISYYHYGLNVVPKVFRLSLVEASQNKIGTIMDRLVLFCLQYDPNKKTYAFYAYNIMRVGAFITALLIGLFLFRFWRKQRHMEI
jgi:protein SCO1/2